MNKITRRNPQIFHEYANLNISISSKSIRIEFVSLKFVSWLVILNQIGFDKLFRKSRKKL